MNKKSLIQAWLWTLVLGGGVLCLQPKRSSISFEDPDSNKLFWIAKKQWGAEFSVVVGGDSRVYQAVSPAVMQETLSGSRIANFAFSRIVWTPEYLDAMASKLDPKSFPKILVLGISPLSLTARAIPENGFSRTPSMNAMQFQIENRLQETLEQFSSWMPLAHSQMFAAADSQGIEHHYRKDGWVPTRAARSDSTAELRAYQASFRDNALSSRVLGNLCSKIQELQQLGIRVYAFRPPTTDAMIALEQDVGQFDETRVADALEKAGATWLLFQNEKYETYDGSHLDENSAIQFSQDLSQKLQSHLALRH